MQLECFTLSTELSSVANVFNEGSIICIILASLLAIVILLSIYLDNKKPKATLSRISYTSNQIIGVAEEFKELEEVDNENSRPPN